MERAWTNEGQVLRRALADLENLLGPKWSVHLEGFGKGDDDLPPIDLPAPDLLLQIGSPGNVFGRMLMQVELNPQPARLRKTLLPKIHLMRRLQGDSATVLLVAPWISPRTAAQLTEWGSNYMDLTGNISIRMDHPGVIIERTGETRDPWPHKQNRGLSGARAGSLVRALIDVEPPYRGQELAEATGVSQPYVSRILEALTLQGIIEREVPHDSWVGWEMLLRARAEQAPLASLTKSVGFIAPNGIGAFFHELHSLSDAELTGFAMTGALAAVQVAPIAVGGQPMLYVREPIQEVARRFGLLTVDQAPDVLLLASKDPSPFRGARRSDDGVPHVALSQLALDCLSGPGRLPAAAEAIIEVMRTNPENWRLENLALLDQLPA